MKKSLKNGLEKHLNKCKINLNERKSYDNPEPMILEIVKKSMPIGISQNEIHKVMKIKQSVRREIFEKLRSQNIIWYDMNTGKWKQVI